MVDGQLLPGVRPSADGRGLSLSQVRHPRFVKATQPFGDAEIPKEGIPREGGGFPVHSNVLNRLARDLGRLVTFPTRRFQPVDELAGPRVSASVSERSQLRRVEDWRDDCGKISGCTRLGRPEAENQRSKSNDGDQSNHEFGRSCGESLEVPSVSHLLPRYLDRRPVIDRVQGLEVPVNRSHHWRRSRGRLRHHCHGGRRPAGLQALQKPSMNGWRSTPEAGRSRFDRLPTAADRVKQRLGRFSTSLAAVSLDAEDTQERFVDPPAGGFGVIRFELGCLRRLSVCWSQSQQHDK